MPAAETVPFADLVTAARRLATADGRRILGITGAPGAGKSTVAQRLVEHLGADAAELVPMDGFHLANEVLDQLERRQRKGAADTFDAAGYAELLRRLRHPDAETVYAPRFVRELEESFGSAIAVAPGIPLVITEGNYLLVDTGSWPAARREIDEIWFIEVDDELRLDRLIRRHVAFGRSPAEAAAWARGTDQRNAELIAATRDRADRVIHLAD